MEYEILLPNDNKLFFYSNIASILDKSSAINTIHTVTDNKDVTKLNKIKSIVKLLINGY